MMKEALIKCHSQRIQGTYKMKDFHDLHNIYNWDRQDFTIQ